MLGESYPEKFAIVPPQLDLLYSLLEGASAIEVALHLYTV